MKEIVFTRWEDVPVVIDLPYLAIILKLSYVHLTNLCKKGQLPAFKVGDSWRVEKDREPFEKKKEELSLINRRLLSDWALQNKEIFK